MIFSLIFVTQGGHGSSGGGRGKGRGGRGGHGARSRQPNIAELPSNDYRFTEVVNHSFILTNMLNMCYEAFSKFW